MPKESYRYYCVDSTGHLHEAEWIEAESDKDAIAQAEAMRADQTWELWRGSRLVAKLWPSRLSA